MYAGADHWLAGAYHSCPEGLSLPRYRLAPVAQPGREYACTGKRVKDSAAMTDAQSII